jgi:hypothetical protein
MGIRISAARAYQKQEKAKEKAKMKFEKVIPNGPWKDEIYLESLVLVRHLKI